MTLTFDTDFQSQASYDHDRHENSKVQRSVGVCSIVGVETNGRTLPVALPSRSLR